VKDLLQFSCVKPIKSVYSVLEEHDALHMLQESLIYTAVAEIIPEGKSRTQIQVSILFLK